MDFKVCHRVDEHAARHAHMTCSSRTQNVGKEIKNTTKKKLLGFSVAASLAAITSMTSNLVHPATYVRFLGHSICQHLLKTERNWREKTNLFNYWPLSSDLFSMPFLSNSQLTAHFIKASSTFQQMETLCSCPVPQNSLRVSCAK